MELNYHVHCRRCLQIRPHRTPRGRVCASCSRARNAERTREKRKDPQYREKWNAYARQWAKENPGKRAAYALKYRTGLQALTNEKFNAIMKKYKDERHTGTNTG